MGLGKLRPNPHGLLELNNPNLASISSLRTHRTTALGSLGIYLTTPEPRTEPKTSSRATTGGGQLEHVCNQPQVLYL